MSAGSHDNDTLRQIVSECLLTDEEFDERYRPPSAAPVSALDQQEGGDHYRVLAIQPVEYIHANRDQIDFLAGNIIKYASRHRARGGAGDVRKIIHYAKLILQLEYGEE
jgi:hypothetical protein